MKFETQEKLILLLLFVYFVMGSTWKFLPTHHLYPFFSWDLYSTIPNTFSVYDIKFYQVGDKKYETPISYKKLFSEHRHELFLLAIDLSVAVKSGNKERIAASQGDFRTIVGKGIIIYELIESVYTPEDYKSGKNPLETHNLGRFSLP